MEVLILSEVQVAELLSYPDLIDSLAVGFSALSRGEYVAPQRIEVSCPSGGGVLAMPGRGPGTPVAIKLASYGHGNQASGLPNVQATITLFDAQSGGLLAIMGGAHITGARTAAAAALSTRLLARKDSKVLTILGAGVQGRFHLELMTCVHEFEEIRIAARNESAAQRLAATHPAARPLTSFEEATRGAHVIAACTSSSEPIIHQDWVDAGAHLTAVGHAPPGGDVDRRLLAESHLFVEHRTAFAPSPVGCSDLAGIAPERGTELGEVLAGTQPGRRDEHEITVYRSMGHVMEDVVAASLVYEKALRLGSGSHVEL